MERVVLAKMDYNMLVDTAVLAGDIMLRSGAETYRVEDTMTRILRTSGYTQCDVFVISTSIMVTISDSKFTPITRVRKVGERTTNLGNLYYANDISRKLCAGNLELKEAHQMLTELLLEKRYPEWLLHLCTIISATSFTLLFNATALECAIAALNGVFIVLSRLLGKKIQIHRFVSNMLVSCIIAISTSLIMSIPWIHVDMEPIIAGSIMPMLPGVALTNAFRDTLQGDYVSGTARLVEAIVIAVSLAVGIGAGLAVGKALLGGVL